MKRITIKDVHFQTIFWLENKIVDWVSGDAIDLDAKIERISMRAYRFPFDSVVSSDDGIYSVIYQKLGTKGLLLKNGLFVRELNRSYYHADAYEYPVTFAKIYNKTYLIHCPYEYCQIDIEDVETGEILTNIKDRKPTDFFHSRLEVSPDNKILISKGWIWHPYDFVMIFDIEKCLQNPLLLDESMAEPAANAEICGASFIDNENILLACPQQTEVFDEELSESLQDGQSGIWNIKSNKLTNIHKLDDSAGGNLIVIDENLAWDLYNFPKIINYKTGQLVHQINDIKSGFQTSSIIHYLKDLPKIAFDKQTKRLAILQNGILEILSP